MAALQQLVQDGEQLDLVFGNGLPGDGDLVKTGGSASLNT